MAKLGNRERCVRREVGDDVVVVGVVVKGLSHARGGCYDEGVGARGGEKAGLGGYGEEGGNWGRDAFRRPGRGEELELLGLGEGLECNVLDEG